MRGMDIVSITTTAKTDAEAKALLEPPSSFPFKQLKDTSWPRLPLINREAKRAKTVAKQHAAKREALNARSSTTPRTPPTRSKPWLAAT